MPDAAIGGALHYALLEIEGVTFATLRAGAGTWLSFGIEAEKDDEALLKVGAIRRDVSRGDLNEFFLPEGYDDTAIGGFEDAAMIVTHGKTVVYSEGVTG